MSRLTTTGTAKLHAGLAAVVYLPLLLTRPGWVSADTKTYLYLDPGQLLSRAWSMWDPSIGMGTVTHQTIGYLWPMGPFFWLTDALGVPDWAAQRLWWGSILFAAGAGVAYLLRSLGWRGPGVTAAVFTYALTPFVLTLMARLSGLLLPYAALPWLLALTIQTVRHRGWRYPALFALTVATCGSVNATALLLVGLAPALWLAHAVWGSSEVPPRMALRAGAKLLVLTVPVSAWWIAGLSVQGSNGLDILRYTETAETVAQASVSHEVLRGLGYWFFYGGDRLGPWIEPSESYTRWLPLVAVSYMIPLGGIGGAVLARWRHRAFFVLLVLMGTALAVGAYPWDEGPLFSRLIQAFQSSEAGLAMRSLPRAVPLVVLGMAVLLGSGVASLVRRWPRYARPARWGSVALALAAMPALWLGQFVPDNLHRRDVPEYWQQAADHLDAQGDDTRVLVLPGSDFASYDWGNTVDPVLPGLMDRPSVQRELIPYGSAASANLLNALDLAIQERTIDPDAIAPIARLLRSGDVLVQSDLQYERYNTPRPRNFWQVVSQATGLGEPTAFGPGAPNETIEDVQLEDELLMLTDPSLPNPPELAVLEVSDAVSLVQAQSAHNPLIVAGDGAGLVDAAGVGLLDGTELIQYSATLSHDEITATLEDGAALLLTDSNRKRGERWTTIRHTRGYTETATAGPLDEDPGDNRLPLFPEAGTDSQSVAVRSGEIDAEATSYGNPITYSPNERPILAIDGDPETAWQAGAFVDARGERLDLSYDNPVTTDSIRLLQPSGSTTRWITEARLRFDGGDPVDVTLGEQSRNDPGQVVRFPERTFTELSVEIVGDTQGELPRYVGQSSMGFAEVEILGDGAPTNGNVEEAVRLPTDLLDAAGTDSIGNPLGISLTRQRQDPNDPTRDDEEAALARLFDLPTAREFSITGTARLSARADGDVVDALLDRPHDDPTQPWVRANSDMDGTVTTASAAFDGDAATAWTTERGRPHNKWVEVTLPEAVTVDQIPLSLVADGLHSVPTEVELSVDGEVVGRIPVPEVTDGDRQNATSDVMLELPEAVTGSSFRLKVTGLREVTTNDWVADSPVVQPVAIAEIGLPGPTVRTLPDTFDSGCRDDLLRADDEPLPVRITGTMADALAARPLTVTPCDGETVDLNGGDHEIRSTPGLDTGIDIDQLVLRSAAEGGPSPTDATLVAEARSADEANGVTTGAMPEIEVLDENPDHVQVRVSGATPDEPFWLVLGQSFNEGWTASMDGRELSAPQLVDGFANGWLVVPTEGTFEVSLRFAPQQRVNAAIAMSLLGVVLCIALLFRRPRLAVVAPSAMPEPYSPVLAFRYAGALPSRRTAYIAGIAVGLLGMSLAGPLVGLAVGVATGVGARHEKFRRWLLLGSPVALALAAGYVLAIQIRYNLTPSFDWPLEVRRVHPLGWLAVLLLVVDVVVGRIWQSRSTEIQD